MPEPPAEYRQETFHHWLRCERTGESLILQWNPDRQVWIKPVSYGSFGNVPILVSDEFKWVKKIDYILFEWGVRIFLTYPKYCDYMNCNRGNSDAEDQY